MDNDIDILYIHRQIMSEFQKNDELIPEIQKRIQDLEYIKCRISSNLKDDVDHDIQILRDKFNEITGNQEKDFYLLNTMQILEKYRVELAKPIHVSFMDNDIPPVNLVKKDLQDKYLKIVNKYIDPSKTPTTINTDVCSSCESTNMAQTKTCIFVCEDCGKVEEINQIIFSYKDNERTNITSKYTYDRRIHFRDCINQFQGKQHSTISQDVYDKLYEKLRSHNLESDGATKQEKYSNVTKQHIYMFLKETGYSKHYEDINLILHNITGYELDDISHLEEQLIQDFDILNELYDQVYIKTQLISRKNFIHTKYVLYQLLKRHKYECKRTDFNFLKTTERQQFHDTICSNLFSILSWNFSSVF